MASPSAPLSKLRKLIGEFPETSERISHGAPTYSGAARIWGGKKTFASFHANHHGDGRIALWCKQPEGVQATLVEADPKTFFVPPYVGTSGWLGVRLDRRPDWGMVRDLLEEGYRTVAPKCAIARLDGD